jgi:hypothetical protein
VAVGPTGIRLTRPKKGIDRRIKLLAISRGKRLLQKALFVERWQHCLKKALERGWATQQGGFPGKEATGMKITIGPQKRKEPLGKGREGLLTVARIPEKESLPSKAPVEPMEKRSQQRQERPMKKHHPQHQR